MGCRHRADPQDSVRPVEQAAWNGLISRMETMRIVVIGATGTIGKAVVKSLSERHEVLQVARSNGDYQVDIASKESVKRLFEMLGPFDALVSTAGQAKFGSLETLSDEDFQLSLSNKLMGQVNLVRSGIRYIRDN